ncbi:MULTISPECIES: hypothetical protein [unclassified Streptomyces]|uniref:hypothetical protein n=1 Tax=unclassified Streptomyces TaxID=2593676 RepID=UPI001F268936|nr:MULTISPECIES: hypothetical protein [unclassified Streptomyces]
MPARISGGLRLFGVGFQRGDDPIQVAQDVLVHLHHPCLAAGLGGGDDLQQLLALFAVLRQELGGGDEQRAGQAGVGVRTGLPHRQAALAIGQGLGHAAEPLLGPGGLGRRPGRVEGDVLALDVDLVGPFPVRADRGVVQPGVVRGHLA